MEALSEKREGGEKNILLDVGFQRSWLIVVSAESIARFEAPLQSHLKEFKKVKCQIVGGKLFRTVAKVDLG